MPTFTGTAGSDTLTGTVDADTLISNGGSDTINAGDGDDTVIVVSQFTGYGTLNGGNGIDTLQIDRALAPVNVLGGGGPYTLSLAIFNNTAQTTLTSFERLAFNSLAGDRISAQFAFGGNGGAANQIGTGLAATAEIVGGAGADELTLLFNTANLPGTVTAPSFTYTNWETATRAYLGDRVTIVATGTGNTTMNGTAHSAGAQGLVGGGGNDIINGSSGMDMLGGGPAGNDQLFGNDGDDTLFLINSYFINPTTGIPSAESTRTGEGSLFDGGSGTDFLLLGGNVNFQGTLVSIEGLVLVPGYTNSNAGATIAVGSQNATFVQFSAATWAALPSNLIVAGQGTVLIQASAGGDTVNLSSMVFDSGTTVLFDLRGGAGNDTLTGTDNTDYFASSGGSDMLNGLAGSDQFFLNNGPTTANGGADNDTFYFYSGAQTSNIAGGTGNDTLYAVVDTVLTGSITEMETIGLQSAVLTMSGTTFSTGFAANTSIFGTGTIAVGMVAGTSFLGQGVVMNTAGVNFSILGSAATDVIKGVINAVNLINGGDATDQIRGGALNDAINGGNGNDKIIGFTGADTLTGGAGADQFRYLFASDSTVGARDHITDFLAGTDKFNFSQLDADPVAAGRQALTFIDSLAFSGTGTAQVRYGVSGADLLVQVDLDGNGTADMEIVLDGASAQTLTGGDFML